MKEYTQGERKRAFPPVDAKAKAIDCEMDAAAYREVAIDLQCELNRAVELLRKWDSELAGRGFAKDGIKRTKIRDFLAHQEAAAPPAPITVPTTEER